MEFEPVYCSVNNYAIMYRFFINIQYYQNYLCAPYGYDKKAYFKDKNKNEYYVLFYQLTNGVDIKIADYKKNKDGKLELIYINPKKCLDKKNNR